jgi:valyl-tRNA synthetase
MPFITEELWQALAPREAGSSIMVAPMPQAGAIDGDGLEGFEIVKEIIVKIREIYQAYNIKKYEENVLCVDATNNVWGQAVIGKLTHAVIQKVEEHEPVNVVFFVHGKKYSLSLGEAFVEYELEKLGKDLAYQQGFLDSVMKKLGNEKFVANAKPEVVAAERKKQADAESKVKDLEAAIAALKNI